MIYPYFTRFSFYPLTILASFLSFKEATQAYLLKTSIPHNKYLIALLYLLIIAYQLNPHPNITNIIFVTRIHFFKNF